MEKVSIIVPVYNGESRLRRCVESILHQDYPDLEVILVDDGSRDGSLSIMEEYARLDNRVKAIHKENGGVSTARNAGIKAARGKWIALLDSDDVWLPNKIEAQWKQIEKHPEIKFIGCNRNQENLHYGTKVTDELYRLNLKQILIKMWPHTSTALIRRSVFKETGLFNEKQKYAEDGEMWNRIAIIYPLYYIPQFH